MWQRADSFDATMGDLNDSSDEEEWFTEEEDDVEDEPQGEAMEVGS